MSVLKRILATILILCLFGVSCDKSKAQKDEVKSENKLVHKMFNIVRIKTDNNKATDEFQRLAKINDDIIRYIVIREDQDK